MFIVSIIATAIALGSTNTIAAIATTSGIAAASTSSQTVKVQAGTGNGTVAQTAFFPSEVEVKVGQSVSWYNPTFMAPEPHTVTFVFDNKTMANVVAAFAVPGAPTKFIALPPSSNAEPVMTAMNTIIGINGRVYDPVVISSSGNVIPLGQNVNYTITGNEKYVNSGFLLPKGQEHTYPGSSNSFTVIFQKAGTYNYICSVHPYMTGKVMVK